MSKSKEHDMLLAAHDLMLGAPELWVYFVAAVNEFAAAKCVEAVQSPVEVALVAHGRAQALLALGDALKELDARVDAIKKGRSRQNRP